MRFKYKNSLTKEKADLYTYYIRRVKMVVEYIILAVLLVASVTLFLTLRTKQANEKSLIAKTFASLVFVAISVLAIVQEPAKFKALFSLGLVCGLVGDIILDLKVMYPEKSKTYFNFGTLMFGIGHTLFFMAVLVYKEGMVLTGFWWVALSSLLFGAMISYLIIKLSPKMNLDMTGYKPQCMAYSTLLIFMMLISLMLAICNVKLCWILADGFALFFVSDMVLSMQYFGGKEQNKVLIIVNHVLYYLAQLAIASWVFFV